MPWERSQARGDRVPPGDSRFLTPVFVPPNYPEFVPRILTALLPRVGTRVSVPPWECLCTPCVGYQGTRVVGVTLLGVRLLRVLPAPFD